MKSHVPYSDWMDFIDQDKYDKNVAKWTAALRSGRYRQGQSTLHYIDYIGDQSKDYFCCLGLGSKVARVKSDRTLTSVLYGARGARTYAPPEFVRWLGFDTESTVGYGVCEVDVHLNNHQNFRLTWNDEDGETGSKQQQQYVSLAGLNDQHVPFDMIADLIDKYGVRARWV